MERNRRLSLWLAMGVAAAAWLLVWALPHEGGFTSVFLMWNIMMVAMMLPSLAPWMYLFGRQATPGFLGGYFTVWAGYCLIATLAQLYLNAGRPAVVSATAAATLLIGAGIFQLTPLKRACLDHCRSPIGQLLTRWTGGKGWAFRTGWAHGVNCLGCCWALMALAFVLGVMNLAWMAVLTLVMCLEKLAPRGVIFSRAVGVSLLIAGVAVLFVA